MRSLSKLAETTRVYWRHRCPIHLSQLTAMVDHLRPSSTAARPLDTPRNKAARQRRILKDTILLIRKVYRLNFINSAPLSLEQLLNYFQTNASNNTRHNPHRQFTQLARPWHRSTSSHKKPSNRRNSSTSNISHNTNHLNIFPSTLKTLHSTLKISPSPSAPHRPHPTSHRSNLTPHPLTRVPPIHSNPKRATGHRAPTPTPKS